MRGLGEWMRRMHRRGESLCIHVEVANFVDMFAKTEFVMDQILGLIGVETFMNQIG